MATGKLTGRGTVALLKVLPMLLSPVATFTAERAPIRHALSTCTNRFSLRVDEPAVSTSVSCPGGGCSSDQLHRKSRQNTTLKPSGPGYTPLQRLKWSAASRLNHEQYPALLPAHLNYLRTWTDDEVPSR